MEIVDANVVLRYLLKDHKTFYPKSRQIIEQKEIYIPAEVAAEIVYVLEKVYEVPRDKISNALTELFSYPNITSSDTPALRESLVVYKKNKIDFVDAILVSYHHINGHIIHSFDKQIRKLCSKD